MKIVFIGSVEFSKRALLKLIDLNANIVSLCTKKNILSLASSRGATCGVNFA